MNFRRASSLFAIKLPRTKQIRTTRALKTANFRFDRTPTRLYLIVFVFYQNLQKRPITRWTLHEFQTEVRVLRQIAAIPSGEKMKVHIWNWFRSNLNIPAIVFKMSAWDLSVKYLTMNVRWSIKSFDENWWRFSSNCAKFLRVAVNWKRMTQHLIETDRLFLQNEPAEDLRTATRRIEADLSTENERTWSPNQQRRFDSLGEDVSKSFSTVRTASCSKPWESNRCSSSGSSERRRNKTKTRCFRRNRRAQLSPAEDLKWSPMKSNRDLSELGVAVFSYREDSSRRRNDRFLWWDWGQPWLERCSSDFWRCSRETKAKEFRQILPREKTIDKTELTARLRRATWNRTILLFDPMKPKRIFRISPRFLLFFLPNKLYLARAL